LTLTVPENDLRLDGNAAAGALQQLFAVEMTSIEAACASCGREEPLGRHHVYTNAPGIVVRCSHCEGVVLCLVETPARTFLDVTGVLRLAAGPLN